MKKFKRIIYVAVVLSAAVVLASCGIQESIFSAARVYSVYNEVESFGIKEYTADEYEDIVFLEISGIEKVYSIKNNDVDSALVVVFKDLKSITSDVMTLLRGDGYVQTNKNVLICRFKVNNIRVTMPEDELENSPGLASPEVEALCAPIMSALPDQKKSSLVNVGI